MSAEFYKYATDKIKIENMDCIVIDVNKDIYKYIIGFIVYVLYFEIKFIF